jgi:hypothetical protein
MSVSHVSSAQYESEDDFVSARDEQSPGNASVNGQSSSFPRAQPSFTEEMTSSGKPEDALRRSDESLTSKIRVRCHNQRQSIEHNCHRKRASLQLLDPPRNCFDVA